MIFFYGSELKLETLIFPLAKISFVSVVWCVFAVLTFG